MNGRVKDNIKAGLGQVIEEFRPGVRLTGQQNILLTDIVAAQRTAVEARLKEYGIASDPHAAGVSRFAMACPALPTCGLALAEAERILPTIMEQIEAELKDLGLARVPLSVRINA